MVFYAFSLLNRLGDDSIMPFIFKPRDQKATDEMISWHYEEPYSFYDLEADEEDLAKFLDPDQRGNSYAVYDEEHQLAGFFSFEVDGDSVEIGLGMRPDLTGKGDGLAFLEEGLAFAKEKFGAKTFELAVAAFNERAIKVYEKAGFRPSRKFMQETNGGHYEFCEMIKEA